MPGDRQKRAEDILGHAFRDPRLLRAALTHPSYAAEHPGALGYDRLEFLGDSVLALVVADHLFRRLPGASEGTLTERKVALVNGPLLSQIAARNGVGDLILFGKGEQASTQGRARSLENALEALIGAVFVDGGLDVAAQTIRRLFGALLDQDDLADAAHPKSGLAERTQARGLGAPVYHVVGAQGPDHARWFTVEVLLEGRRIGLGEGCSKQAAQKAAAAAALAAMDAEEAGSAGDSGTQAL